MSLQHLMFANSQLWGAPGFQDVPSRTCKWTHAISSGGSRWQAIRQAVGECQPHGCMQLPPTQPASLSHPLVHPQLPEEGQQPGGDRLASLTVHPHSPPLCREWYLFLTPLLHIVQKKKKTGALLKYTDSWISSQTWQYKYLKTEALESVFILSPLIDFYVKIKNHCNPHLYLALVWDSGVVNTKYRIS